MSAAAAYELTVTDAPAMMRELRHVLGARVKNKAYRSSPIGREVARFLRAKRWEGLAATSYEAYELVLGWFAVEHEDFDGLDIFCSPVGTEYIRAFLENRWGDSADATKAQRLAIVRSFFKWEVGEGRLPYDPSGSLKAPRKRGTDRLAYRRDTILRLLAGQGSDRDVCALGLLCRMALRKNELRLLQVRDVDLARNLLVVKNGKGGTTDVLPIGFPTLRDDLYLHLIDRAPDEFLLYPKRKRFEPMDPSSVHRWFKRCLTTAGLPATIKLHELRHSAADALWRETGDLVLASKLLRHRSVGTTQGYLHPTHEDLAAAMARLDRAWSEE